MDQVESLVLAHYGASSISQILDVPGQEFRSPHFFTLLLSGVWAEPSCIPSRFAGGTAPAKRFNQELRSVVFQETRSIAPISVHARTLGFSAYRGNPPFWWYQHLPERQEKRAWLRRGLRLADNYANISGARFRPSEIVGAMTDVPASRFLRPWSQHFRQFEPYRLRRIQKELEVAAENSSTYHLWWHPHNFRTKYP